MELFVSDKILTRLNRILANFPELDEATRNRFVSDVKANVTTVFPPTKKRPSSSNADEVIACAMSCDTHFIISGDINLLKLHPYKGALGIYHPNKFRGIMPGS